MTEVNGAHRGSPPAPEIPAPIAPYGGNPAAAVSKASDRITGKPVKADQLKTYAEVLAQYHLSPKGKFENGNFLNSGRTKRRHVVATGFDWIGKEANQVGGSGEADPIRSPVEILLPQDKLI